MGSVCGRYGENGTGGKGSALFGMEEGRNGREDLRERTKGSGGKRQGARESPPALAHFSTLVRIP